MVELGVAYQGCMHPHHLEPDLREIAAMGCSYINMTVNECDWSAWEPFVALSSLDTFSTDPYWIHERTTRTSRTTPAKPSRWPMRPESAARSGSRRSGLRRGRSPRWAAPCVRPPTWERTCWPCGVSAA